LLHFVLSSQTTEACIARCARNVITTPKIVVTSENLAVADVGNLDMALASVGKFDDEKTTGKYLEAYSMQ
jgi:endonuclease III